MEQIQRKIRLWEHENLRELRKLKREFIHLSQHVLGVLFKQTNLISYLIFVFAKFTLRTLFVFLRSLLVILGRHEIRVQISPEESRGVSEYYRSTTTSESIAPLLKR